MIKTRLFPAQAVRLHPVAFDNKAGWLLDDKGAIVVRDGNPVYVDDKGAELALASDTVKRLSDEAGGFRKRATEAEAKVAAFADIDPTKAKEALETVKSLAQGDLIKKGEVDRVKAEIAKTFETQLAEKDKVIGETTGKLSTLVRRTAFNSSQWIKDNIAVPPDVLEAFLGSRFKQEGEGLIGIQSDGSPVMSRKKAGENASFDEALEIFVSEYANKDSLLKGNNQSGSGNNGNGGGNGKGRNVRRADFDKMPPAEQATIAAQARKGELNLID